MFRLVDLCENEKNEKGVLFIVTETSRIVVRLEIFQYVRVFQVSGGEQQQKSISSDYRLRFSRPLFDVVVVVSAPFILCIIRLTMDAERLLNAISMAKLWSHFIYIPLKNL